MAKLSVTNPPKNDDNRVEKRKRSLGLQRSSAIYFCENCDFQTNKAGNLRQHVESIHERIRYPCDQCQYKATVKKDLKKHVESIHLGVRYPCNHCDFLATYKGHLTRHLRKHTRDM